MSNTSVLTYYQGFISDMSKTKVHSTSEAAAIFNELSNFSANLKYLTKGSFLKLLWVFVLKNASTRFIWKHFRQSPAILVYNIGSETKDRNKFLPVTRDQWNNRIHSGSL